MLGIGKNEDDQNPVEETQGEKEARLKKDSEGDSESSLTKDQIDKNPAPGEDGHKCFSPAGKYMPKWKCILIAENVGTPDRVYAQAYDGPKTVKTGIWVDVPPEIYRAIANAGHTESKPDDETGLGGPGQGQSVARYIRRFSVSMRDSA